MFRSMLVKRLVKLFVFALVTFLFSGCNEEDYGNIVSAGTTVNSPVPDKDKDQTVIPNTGLSTKTLTFNGKMGRSIAALVVLDNSYSIVEPGQEKDAIMASLSEFVSRIDSNGWVQYRLSATTTDYWGSFGGLVSNAYNQKVIVRGESPDPVNRFNQILGSIVTNSVTSWKEELAKPAISALSNHAAEIVGDLDEVHVIGISDARFQNCRFESGWSEYYGRCIPADTIPPSELANQFKNLSVNGKPLRVQHHIISEHTTTACSGIESAGPELASFIGLVGGNFYSICQIHSSFMAVADKLRNASLCFRLDSGNKPTGKINEVKWNGNVVPAAQYAYQNGSLCSVSSAFSPTDPTKQLAVTFEVSP